MSALAITIITILTLTVFGMGGFIAYDRNKRSYSEIAQRVEEQKAIKSGKVSQISQGRKYKKAVEKYSDMLPEDVRIVNGEDDMIVILEVHDGAEWLPALITDRAKRDNFNGEEPNASCRRLINAYIESNSLTTLPVPMEGWPTWESRKSRATRTASVIGQRYHIKSTVSKGFVPKGFKLWAIARNEIGKNLFNTLSPKKSPYMEISNRRTVCTAWNAFMEHEQMNGVKAKQVTSKFLMRENMDNDMLREIGWR